MVAQDKRPLQSEIAYPYIQGDRVSERHSQEDAKHTSLQGGTLGILFFLLLQPESFIPNRVHQKYGLCRYSVGNYRTSPAASVAPTKYRLNPLSLKCPQEQDAFFGESFPRDISTELRKVPNEDHIWWIYEQQKHIKMNLQPHQVPPQVPHQVPHQVLVFLIFR